MSRRALQAVDDNLQGSSATDERIISLVNHQGSDFFRLSLGNHWGYYKKFACITANSKNAEFQTNHEATVRSYYSA